MEIIKKGTKTPPDKRVYIAKCRVCGCIFTYMEKDMEYRYPNDSEGVTCPQCNYWVFPFIKRKYKGDVKNEN